MTLLGKDFEILKEERSSGLAYKLGKFRAFTGQDDHARHDYYRKNLSRIS